MGGGAFITGLTSCENFLKSAEIRQQIEDSIAYANATSSILFIKSDPAMGTFLSEGEKECKIGYSIDLQFMVNSESYIFKTLEAVSINNNTQSRSDCITFTINEQESEPSKGIYKIKANLHKKSDDILIQPVCIPIPKVIDYSPSFEELSYANTSITITFNMPMEASDISPDNSIFNYSNISIFYNHENIADLVENNERIEIFETPYFDKTKTKLTLAPKGRNLYEWVKYGKILTAEERNNIDESNYSNLYTFDIQIKLSDDITITTENGPSKLAQNGKTAFYVHYKLEMEQEIPTESSFFLTRNKITESSESIQTFSEIPLENMTDTEILQNRVKDFVYIYGQYYDNQSGVKSVTVSETHTNTETGDVNYNERFPDIEYVNTPGIAEFTTDETGLTSFVIKHEVQSENGAVLLSILVKDACGNSAPAKEFTVIKRGSITPFYDLYNIPRNITDGPFNIQEYNSTTKKNVIIYNKANNEDWYWNWWDGTDDYELIDPIYGSTYLYQGMPGHEKLFTIKGEYTDKYGNIKQQEFTYHGENEDEKYWDLNLNVDSVNGLELKVTITDDIGSKDEQIWKFPSEIAIKRVYNSEYNNKRYIEFYEKDSLNKCSWVPIYTTNNKNYYYSTDTYLTTGVTYFATPKQGSLAGDFDITKTFNYQTTVTQPTPPTITSHSVTLNEEFGYLNLTFNISASEWNTFSRIYIRENNSSYILGEFEPGTTSVTFKYKSYRLFTTSSTAFLTAGIKNGVMSTEKYYYVPMVTDTNLDNYIPEYYNSLYFNTFENYYFTFQDYCSGVKNATIRLNKGEPIVISQDNVDKIDGRRWYKYFSFDELKHGDNIIDFRIIDNNNNINEGTFSASIDRDMFYFTSITKTSNSLWTFNGKYNNKGGVTNNKAFDYYKYEDDEWKLVYESKHYAGSNDDIIWFSYNPKPTWQLATVDEDNKTFTNAINKIPSDIKSLNNTFIKILCYCTQHSSNTIQSPPFYYYLGEPSSGNYDLIFRNGNSKNSMAIQSDKPVFVHTLVASNSYNECKDWSYDFWEAYKKSIGETVLVFPDPNISGPQRYSIPTNQIKKGECYCVIAHFANGDVQVSEVMVKD